MEKEKKPKNEDAVLAKAKELGQKIVEVSVNVYTNKIDLITIECPVCKKHRKLRLQQQHSITHCVKCTKKLREARRYENRKARHVIKYY